VRHPRKRAAAASPRRWPLRLVVSLLLASGISACGSSTQMLNIAAVERAVAQSILTERQIYAMVGCPARVPQRAGLVFTCTAALTVGSYPVTVREIDGKGHVRYANSAPLVILNISGVEHAIKRSIHVQRHLDAKVSCPAEVLQKAGIVFTCTATVGGRGYPFTVTEIDGNGHVRYVGNR
jgi:hypothetical protein